MAGICEGEGYLYVSSKLSHGVAAPRWLALLTYIHIISYDFIKYPPLSFYSEKWQLIITTLVDERSIWILSRTKFPLEWGICARSKRLHEKSVFPELVPNDGKRNRRVFCKRPYNKYLMYYYTYLCIFKIKTLRVSCLVNDGYPLFQINTDLWFHRFYDNFKIGPKAAPLYVYKFTYLPPANEFDPHRRIIRNG